MNVSELLAEVDRRVAEQIVPHLLKEGIRRHSRSKDWKECDCSYCSTRQRSSHWLSRSKIPSSMNYTSSITLIETLEDIVDLKRERREAIRVHFQQQLKRAIDEFQ